MVTSTNRSTKIIRHTKGRGRFRVIINNQRVLQLRYDSDILLLSLLAKHIVCTIYDAKYICISHNRIIFSHHSFFTINLFYCNINVAPSINPAEM